jgi:hypothetical protein
MRALEEITPSSLYTIASSGVGVRPLGKKARGYPKGPTNEPLDAMSLSDSSQVCAWTVDRKASSQMPTRPPGSENASFIVEVVVPCVCGV